MRQCAARAELAKSSGSRAEAFEDRSARAAIAELELALLEPLAPAAARSLAKTLGAPGGAEPRGV